MDALKEKTVIFPYGLRKKNIQMRRIVYTLITENGNNVEDIGVEGDYMLKRRDVNC